MEGAFYGCTSLRSVGIPGGVTNIDAAFYQCSNLTAVVIPNNVASIADLTFEGCSGIKNMIVPQNITNIASDAFEGSGLTNISILGDVNIEEYAFYQLPLCSVHIEAGVIGDYAFQLCTNLKNLTLGNGVLSFGTSAFQEAPLSSLIFPSSVTNIGDGAFAECALTNVAVPSGATIAGYAVLGNPLTCVTLADFVSVTDDQVFFECTNLTNVIVGTGVSNLSYGMFGGCEDLANVFFLGNAPGIVGSYPSDGPAFSGDTNVTVYYMPGTTGWSTNYQGAPTALWNPIIEAGDGNFGVINGQFGFDVKGDPGIPIVVEACTNLANPVWTPVQSMTVTNGLIYFTDPNWSNYPTRYYGIGFP